MKPDSVARRKVIRRAIAPIIEQLESRQYMTAVLANFTDGNGTSSVDQYAGKSGSGWNNAWQSTAQNSSFTTATVTNTSPLNSGGNYLSATLTASGGTARGAISRAYSDTGNVDPSGVHEIQMDFRVDSALTTFTDSNDQVTIYGDTGAHFAPQTSDTMLISAFGAAVTGVAAQHWNLMDGDGAGGGTRVDTGISLTQGTTYHFTIIVDSANDRYSVSMNDGSTGSGHSYASSWLGWHHNTTFTTSSHPWIEAGVRVSGTSEAMSFSMDSVKVTPPPPAAATSLSATAASSSQINLLWTDNSSTETGFVIERSTDNTTWTSVTTTAANATSYSDTGLSAGTLYYYRVRATDEGGDSSNATASATTNSSTPTAPTGLTATADSSSTTQINLAWTDNSSNETGFKIDRSTDNSTWTSVTTTSANATSYSDSSGLSAGTLYYYRVRATNASGDSTNATASATTGSLPSAPTGLSLTVVSESQINLAWTDNSSNETGFKIERSTDNSTWTTVTTTSANVTSYNNTSGLSGDTLYYYRVRATNSWGDSSNATASDTTLSNTPTDLAITWVSATLIDLAWDDNSINETGYKVERKTGSGGTWAQIGTTAANATTYEDTTIVEGTTYYYRVRAAITAGDSAYSSEVNATTDLLGPTDFTATATSDTAIDLAWTDNSSVETGYLIERSLDELTWTTVTTTAADVTSYSDTGLSADTHYYYRITAVNSLTTSASETADTSTQSTPSDAPSDLHLTWVSATLVDLAWDDNSSTESGFEVERKTGSGGTWALIGTTGVNETSYKDTTISEGTHYYYRVRAAITAGDSDYSDEIDATTDLLAPTDVTATAASDVAINLTWTDNSALETGFEIERSTDNSTWTTVTTTAANAVSYTDTGLSADTQYYYQIKAVNSDTDSDFATADATTGSATIIDVVRTDETGGTITTRADFSSSFDGAKAFDANTASKWIDNDSVPSVMDPSWIQYQFANNAAYAINKYTITSAEDATERDPEDWSLLASNDGSTWTTVDTRTGETFSSRLQKNTYTFSNSTAYKYYRLSISANEGASDLTQLSEIELIEQVAVHPTNATLPASDDFNRANSTYSGDIWTESAGDWAVRDNALISLSSGDSTAVLTGISESNVTVSADVNLAYGQGAPATGVIARASGDDYYLAKLFRDGYATYAEIDKVEGGVSTQLDQRVLFPVSLDPYSATLTLDVRGSTLSLIVNGNLVGSVIDSDPLSAGSVGVYASDSSLSYDNFAADTTDYSVDSATLPFSDDFNRTSSGYLGSTWTDVEGDFAVSGNAAQSMATGTSRTMLNDVSVAGVSAVADVSVVGAGDAWAGLALRADDDDYYLARLRRNGSNSSVVYAEIGLMQDGVWTELASTDSPATSGTLQFDAYGSRLALFLNGQVVITASDDTLTSGDVGLVASRDGSTFDNASVAEITSDSSDAELPFTDDFGRATGTSLGSSWSETNGDLQIASGKLTQHETGLSTAIVNGISATDVVASADVDMSQARYQDDGSVVGLDLRISESGEYRGQLRYQGGIRYADILKFDGTSWTTLDSRDIGVGVGKLRFEAIGGELRLYLDGTPVAMASDSSLAGAGGVGVAIQDTTSTLDNYSVQVADSAPTPTSATLPVTDDFNRDDTAYLPSQWTKTGGEIAVGSDQLRSLYAADSSAELNDLSVSDVRLVGNIDMAATRGVIAAFDARINGDDRYRGQIRLDSNDYYAEILKEVDGVWTTIDSRLVIWPTVDARPVGMGTGTLRFDVQGDQLGLYLNDKLEASADDADVSAAGTVGVFAEGATRFDDLNFSTFAPATPTSASLTFDDNFDRADDSIELGTQWTQQSGDYAIRDQQMIAMAEGDSLTTLNGVSAADIVVSAQVNVPTAQSVGLVARYSGPGDANYYEGDLSASGGAEIWKNVDGVQTLLASATSPATSGTLRFEVTGNLLQLFLNDALLVSVNDSSITAAGSVGVAGVSDGTAQATLDNFDARVPSNVTNAYLVLPTQSASTVNYWKPGESLSDITTGNFSGDGRTDVFGYDSATGNLVVGLSNGVPTPGAPTGTTAYTTQIWGNWSPSTSWEHFTVGDFNGDGLADIAAYDPATGTWQVGLSSGSSFTTETWASWSSDDTYQNIVAGDFNGDGRSDLAAWDNTAGTWQAAVSTGTSFTTSTWGTGTAGQAWASVLVGDFNGDGRQDLAALDSSSGNWHTELSNGNGFNDAIWATWNSSTAWNDFQVGDFNGDGLSDIVATAPDSSSWQVALSTGSGFTTQSWGTQAANLTNQLVGDFDGDGKTDIAGQVPGTNQWRVELSSGSDFTDQYWLTTSAAISVQGVLAGNSFGLAKAAAKDFETVYNTIQYQPYSGAMKGALATEETGTGNDWDQDALLVQLLNQDGIQTQYVSGVIAVPTAEVLNWLGVHDTAGAVDVLNAANLKPTVLNSGQSNEEIEFDHTWLEALLPTANGLQWQAMDPSFKSQNLQAGISGLSDSVPFSLTDYLANETKETPLEYYEDQVVSYLAANDPTQSIADMPSTGPIVAKQLGSIPLTLPYTVIGTPTTSVNIPSIMTDRVELVLQDVIWGGVWETPLDYTVSVPAVALDTLAITYTQNSDGNYMPELRINGQAVQASSSGYVVGGDDMRLLIEHYLPGSDTISSTSTYDEDPGTTIAIGLDADQFSNASVEALQTQVNGESLAVENGDANQTQAAFDDGLSLTVEEYFQQNDQAASTIAGLNQLVNVHAGVGDGILTSDPSQIQYNWFADVPIASINTGFNIEGGAPGGMIATNGTDGQHADKINALTLLATEGSFLESSVPEQVLSLRSVSSISAIQWANKHTIPVLTIDDSNESTLLPELTLPSSQVSLVQEFLDQGDTVIIPENELTIGAWTGTAMILQNITSDSFYQGDAVVGNSVAHGSFGDCFEDDNPPPPPNQNQDNSGDPVDTATGAFTRQDTDVTIPNIGIPLAFTRYYISNSTADIGLGQGWTDTYSDTMVAQSSGDVLWTDSKGDQYTFTPNGSGGYTDPVGLFGTLTTGDDGFVWTDTHGNIRAFNLAGRLAEIEDANGNSLIISYDTDGNLESVQDGADSSRELTFTSSNGHITSTTDFTGRTWTYTYDTVTNSSDQTIYLLTSCTTPSDETTPADTTEYGYAVSGALTGLMTSITDSVDGKSIGINYYPNGKAFSVTDPDGNMEYFFNDLGANEATYINANGQAEVNEFNAQGLTIKQINSDQTQVTSVWDNGLLQSQTDAMGKTSTYEYDSEGNLIQYVAPDGIETDAQFSTDFNLPTQITVGGVATSTYTYDANGNMTSITDPVGDETTMTYYSNGLLETLTAPNGNAPAATGDFTTTYTYNDAGQVLTATTGLPSTITNTYDSRGDLTSTTNSDENEATYTYDLLGRLLTATGPDPDGSGGEASAVSSTSYDLAADEVTYTDPLGNQNSIYTDGNARVVKAVNPDGTFVTDTYDAVGNLIASIDERGQTTQYIYDGENRLIETLLPNGGTLTTTYNADGQVTSTTDADGNATLYAYNDAGQLASVTNALNQVLSYTYDDLGNVTTVTDPSGTTTFTRDLLGRVTQTRAPGDVITTTDYDADGNVTNQTLYDVSGLETIPSDPRTLDASRKQSTTTTYDVLDRPIEVTNPADNDTFTTYDAAGLVTSVTDGLDHATTYDYDHAGRLITETASDPDGEGELAASVTQYAYDADNNLISETDPQSNTTTYAYNDLNELVATTAPAPGTGPDAPVTTYQYNTDGEQTSITDPDGNVTFYTYDSVGNQVTKMNALGAKWTYQYDDNDNLASTTDADGRTIRYVYDALNRVTQENWIDSDDTTVINSIQYTYNDKGQLETIGDSSGSYSYTYNDAGQVTDVDNTGTPDFPDVTLSQTYDGFGNRSSLSAAVDETTQFTNDYQYDPLGELTQVTQSGSGLTSKEADFTYNADGQSTGISLIAGGAGVASAAYGYDLANRLTSLTWTNTGDSSTIASYSLAYNADNQITEAISNDGTIDYTYDHDGQVTGASGNALAASESYSYDSNGNRTNTGDTTGTNNELASDGTYTYAYDADGNLITQTTIATGATENFTWDYRNRLTDVTYKDGEDTITQRIHYTYDPLNRRISQQVDSDGDGTYDTTEQYVYDGSSVVMVLDGDGNVTHAFLNSPGGLALADDASSGNVTWNLTDQQGSVRDVVDDSGTIVDHLQYDSYGNILSQSSPGDQPRFAYAGMQLDQATGLYYDNARYYSSSTGQFISQDPVGFAGGNVNLHGYVNNDPINLIDPSGLSPKGPPATQPSPGTPTPFPGASSDQFLVEPFSQNATYSLIAQKPQAASTSGQVTNTFSANSKDQLSLGMTATAKTTSGPFSNSFTDSRTQTQSPTGLSTVNNAQDSLGYAPPDKSQPVTNVAISGQAGSTYSNSSSGQDAFGAGASLALNSNPSTTQDGYGLNLTVSGKSQNSSNGYTNTISGGATGSTPAIDLGPFQISGSGSVMYNYVDWDTASSTYSASGGINIQYNIAPDWSIVGTATDAYTGGSPVSGPHNVVTTTVQLVHKF